MRRSFVLLIILSSRLSFIPALHSNFFQSDEHTGECPGNGITAWNDIWSKGEGFGSTYFDTLGVYMYAALEKKTYCTTQWNHTSRGVPMSEMFQWVGGSEFGPPATSQTARRDRKRWETFDLHSQTQRDIFMEARKRIRDYYFEHTKRHNESLNLFGEGNGASENVAWHIRRGDVGMDIGAERYITNDEISQGLIALYKAFAVRKIHFFSEGNETEFQSINETCVSLGIGCVWHLNSPQLAVHYSFSVADILIMARSAFSGTAAFLNRGKVFLLPSEYGRQPIHPLDVQTIWNRCAGLARSSRVFGFPLQPLQPARPFYQMGG